MAGNDSPINPDAVTPGQDSRAIDLRRRRRRRWMAVGTMVGAVVVALGVAEIVLRVRDTEPVRFAYDGQVGYINRPNASFMFKTMQVHTGAAGRIASATPAEHSRPDLLVVGDSYAAGQCASWPEGCVEIATAILARERPGFTTVNLGTSGYGTDQCLLRLREFLPARSRLVVYLMCDNDLHDNFDHFHFGLFKPRFELHGSDLVQVQRASAFNWLVLHSRVAGACMLPFARSPSHMTAWQHHNPAERAALGAALVAEMKRECDEAGSRFVVVAHWLASQKTPDEDFASAINTMRGAGVDVVVLNERLDLGAHYDPACWHWNTEGHREVGEVLAGLVREREDAHH